MDMLGIIENIEEEKLVEKLNSGNKLSNYWTNNSVACLIMFNNVLNIGDISIKNKINTE